jgi:glycosyltransferase involved in cell wall biosynthesis
MKILFVSHNHPEIRPGGAEGYALDVYEGVREAGEFEPVLLSRSGPPISIGTRHHDGRPITLVNHDPHQYFFYTDMSDWDWVFGRSPKKPALTRFFREFLLEQKPDIVHFQHTMYMGYDILRVTRNALPDVPIVYTLHEYLPICQHNGQMVRTMDRSLCDHDSPRRCHECFPRIPQQTFFMRKRFIQSQMSVVDLFVTPSAGALEQYVRWGIPRERIVHEPHGFVPARPLPEHGGERKRNRDRFGFFGQFTEFKGADVLLEAFASLTKRYAHTHDEDFPGRLWIHGANLDTAPAEFQDRFRELLEDAGDRVRLIGQYDRADIAKLMARIDWVVIPSIWWETGPLTVGEAFQHDRPVICSDMGGMSEKVTDGVNGLYFRRGDADELADVIERAATTPSLWEELRRGIPPVPTMREHVASLSSQYRRLLASRAPAPPRAPDGERSRPRVPDTIG